MKNKILKRFGFKTLLPLLYVIFVLIMLRWIWLINTGALPDGCEPGAFICINVPTGLLVLTALPTLLISNFFGFDFTENKTDSVMLFGLLITVPLYFLLGLIIDLMISKFFRNKREVKK